MAPKTKVSKQIIQDSAPVDSAPVDSAPVDSAPVDSAPVDSAPKQDTVVKKASVKKAVVKKAPAKKADIQVIDNVVQPVDEPVEQPKKKRNTKKVVEGQEEKHVLDKKPVQRKAKKDKVPEEGEEEVEEEGDIKTRSFKVKLPNEEVYTGRFTGLTPYQAANKALSKYFRGLEVENNSQVNFSIRESTRGSKRHEYIYKGSRLKLEIPITYTIKSAAGDERIITKQYKNQLIKVKKGLAKQEAVTI